MNRQERDDYVNDLRTSLSPEEFAHFERTFFYQRMELAVAVEEMKHAVAHTFPVRLLFRIMWFTAAVLLKIES